MHRSAKTTAFLVLTAALATLAASCQKEEKLAPKGSSPKIIPVVKSVSTKAQAADRDFNAPTGRLLSERVVSSADGFELIEMVYENDLAPAGTVQTKGTAITTENISSFNMECYAEGSWYDNTISGSGLGTSGNRYPAGLYFKAGVTKSSGTWGLSKSDGPAKPGDSGELYWLNDVPMTFWSYSPTSISTFSRTGTNTATFTHTVSSTVSAQTDPVFAFSSETRKYHDAWDEDYGKLDQSTSTSGAGDTENVNVWFFHALSAVQFLQNESLTDYRVSNVTIQNVHGSSTCTMTSTATVPSEGNPNITFSHNLTGSADQNYSQAYEATDLADGGSLKAPADAATNGNFKKTDAKTFFMVPQTLGAESTDAPSAALQVTFVYKGTGASGSEQTSATFDLPSTTWEAGKYYVYKVDLAGNIHVEISEQCPDDVKSDVKFQNTSNVNEYIRAAVVANWYDASGNIVAAWDKTRDGDISLGSGWTESGGFYYHTAPVAAKEFTGNLFDSFTKPTSAPVSDAHFEMTILVQAVASDGIASCISAF